MLGSSVNLVLQRLNLKSGTNDYLNPIVRLLINELPQPTAKNLGIVHASLFTMGAILVTML